MNLKLNRNNVTLMFVASVLFIGLAVGSLGTQSVLAADEFSVYYGMNHPSAASPDVVEAVVSNPNVDALYLMRGPGLMPRNLTNGFSADHWMRPNPSLEDSIEAGLYFQFGLTIKPGFTGSLSTLDLSLRRSTKPAPNAFALQASLDGFATPGITIYEFNYYGRASGTAPAVDPTIDYPYYYMEFDLPGRGDSDGIGDPIPTVDLSAFPELQNIEGGTTVTFRLYAWGKSDTSDASTVALGRVVGPKVTGTLTAAD